MDNTNNVGHEDLDFYFDDDDMLLNENPAPRPSEANSLLNREHVQSLTGMGSSNDEELEFHLGGGDDSSMGDGNTSSSSNSSENREHDAGGVQNDATEDGMDSLDNAAFSKMAEDAERNNSLHEFLDIISKTFASEEEAYNFYNNYARDKGFSVRKQKVRRSKRSGQLLFRRFLCSKQGEREAKWLDKEVFSRRPRGLTRCGCSAKLEVRLDKKRGLWYVHNFVDEHNHCLATQDEVPFLRSHRKMKDFQKTEIMEMEGAGIRKHVIMDVLQCRYGGYGEVGIVKKDAYNFCSRYKRGRIEKGDAMAALGLMQKRQRVDPDFYFEYQLDGDGHLKNMFWCDSQSRMDYRAFGDVVVFDSTYRTNKYKMPFVPFVGLNHHRSTTVFGCGIVSDEGVASYVWMLSAFVKAMCQQKPLSIITDGDYAMMKAIRQVLPGVNHRICSWHVENNLPKHLSHKSVEAFRPLVYYGTSPATFEQRWNAFLAKHQTKKNSHWLRMMHRNKKLWAASFQFEKYFLGLTSNQRSESMNSCLQKSLDRQMTLLELVQRYENNVSDLRQTEAGLDCNDSQSVPVPLTNHRPIEVACSHVFTATNFYKLQEQISYIDDFLVFETLVRMDSERHIVVRKQNKKSIYLVDYYCYAASESTMKCTCRKMEREGLPCCHIFCVLDHLKMSAIPHCCIQRRHCKDAKGGIPSRREGNKLMWSAKRERYSNLTKLGAEAFDVACNNPDEFCKLTGYLGGIISKKHRSEYNRSAQQKPENETYHFSIQSVRDPVVVKNKGAPRKNGNSPGKQHTDGKRIKAFHETRRITCSICSKGNHNRRTCPWRVRNNGT